MEENEYMVRKVELGDHASLRDIWHRLEAGPDMTFFQKYEWYETIRRFVPEAKGIECGYYVVEKDGVAVMIAPLWIVTRTIRWVNRPGVFLLGRKGYSDYLNLIYDDFDENAFRSLVEYVKTLHGVKVWNFEYLPDSTLLTHIRKNIGQRIYVPKHESALTYCGVTLPADESEYMKSLSQKTRQNIRTAINRAKKDGVSLVINYDDNGMRRLLTIKDESTGEIAAFFNYGVDEAHRTIVVVTAGVNRKYARYSPGLVCAKDFICHCINSGKISYFDFTRGVEPYKYWLGAKDRKVTNISIRLQP